MIATRKNLAGLFAACVAALGLAFVAAAPAPAYAQASQTLDPAVARVLQSVFEMMQADQHQQALAELNRLMAERGERMKPFDRATTLELRGSTKAALEDYRGALRDFEAVIALNALPVERMNQIRYFVAQLYFQVEDYPAAIRGLQEWIRLATAAGQRVDPNAYYLLAAAFVRTNNYRASMQPAEQAVAGLTEPRKGFYDLLNLIYSELNENAKRAQLLERMINFWPNDKNYWVQLSGLYSTLRRDQEAFSVLEVAYRAGLLTTEGEILTLVQYYSFFENPYRGAKLLERELGTRTVNRNVRTLTLLSQLWSQAREHKRAIPILREAAQLDNRGELFYRLGQVLLADEQYAEAERALVNAINRGGLDANKTGDCWLLLGTTRFSQAGPGDRATRARAREAFVRATNYNNVRTQARQWISYIDAINDTECRQDELERAQQAEERRLEVDRLRTSLQVCRLQGRPVAECQEVETRLRAVQDQIAAAEASRQTYAACMASTQPASTPAAGGGAEDSAPAQGEDREIAESENGE